MPGLVDPAMPGHDLGHHPGYTPAPPSQQCTVRWEQEPGLEIVVGLNKRVSIGPKPASMRIPGLTDLRTDLNIYSTSCYLVTP